MKKLSNKILIIVLVVLVAVFALSKVFRSPGLESNLVKDLIKLDTAKVTEVRIQSSKEGSGEIKLLREGKKWKVSSEGKLADAGAGVVQSMLGVMKDMQVERMVTRKKERWDDFQVGEEGTRVSVYNGSEKLADVKIGKTGFDQSQQSRGGGPGGAFTYVRLTDDDEVYVTEGFISMHFNKKYNDWRNQMFLKVNKDEVTKIDFIYPDSSFTLEKRDSLWYVGGTQAVETKVTQYFSKIRFKNVNEFDDGFTASSAAPVRIQISGSAGEIATAQAWPKNDQEFVMSSTMQEGVYFLGKKNGAVKDIFVGSTWFTEP